mgnify:FL=1
MSERWGLCKDCKGCGYVIIYGTKLDCMRCDATGWSGDVEDYPWK